MRKEKGVFFDFAGAAGFDHVDGDVWRVHDLTKDKRTACVYLILYLSTLSQQKYT